MKKRPNNKQWNTLKKIWETNDRINKRQKENKKEEKEDADSNSNK